MASARFWLTTLGAVAIVTLVLGWGANRYLIDQRVAELESRLQLQNNLRLEALNRYLSTAEAELRFWSTNNDLVNNQHFLSRAWQDAVDQGLDPEQRLRQVYIEDNPYPLGQRNQFADTPQDSPYRTMHSQLHPLARKFVTERGYYDFFLIDPEGNVSYTVEKEDDFGTNLLTGRYSDTGLADVFRRAIEGEAEDLVVYSDFEAYAPSAGAPAMFMANAMHDYRGNLIGVLALQLPTQRIASIMEAARGDTATGEAYIVGEDRLMRSQSRFSEESTILTTRVDTPAVDRALSAEIGVTVIEDYRGEPVYSAYSSIPVDQHRWALLVEIDQSEVLEWASGHHSWLAGILLFFYSLGAWSIWYLRGADSEAASLFADTGLDGSMDVSEG